MLPTPLRLGLFDSTFTRRYAALQAAAVVYIYCRLFTAEFRACASTRRHSLAFLLFLHLLLVCHLVMPCRLQISRLIALSLYFRRRFCRTTMPVSILRLSLFFHFCLVSITPRHYAISLLCRFIDYFSDRVFYCIAISYFAADVISYVTISPIAWATFHASHWSPLLRFRWPFSPRHAFRHIQHY